jgi:SAM-dependent methyltransferase
MKTPATRQLLSLAASRYRPVGHVASKWAQGKMSGDPLFIGVLRHQLIRDRESVLDLGCGQGLLAALLIDAATQYAKGQWSSGPEALPAPPRNVRLRGIELFAADVARANIALRAQADIRCGDICKEDFGSADVAVIIDVLHYVDFDAQRDVLQRVFAALNPGGRLLLRVGDANAGWGFRWSNWVDKTVVLARSRSLCKLWCRPMVEWVGLLEELGFTVAQLPMSQGTAFANVLLVAEKKNY